MNCVGFCHKVTLHWTRLVTFMIKLIYMKSWRLSLAYVRMSYVSLHYFGEVLFLLFVDSEDEFELFAGSGSGSGWRRWERVHLQTGLYEAPGSVFLPHMYTQWHSRVLYCMLLSLPRRSRRMSHSFHLVECSISGCVA